MKTSNNTTAAVNWWNNLPSNKSAELKEDYFFGILEEDLKPEDIEFIYQSETPTPPTTEVIDSRDKFTGGWWIEAKRLSFSLMRKDSNGGEECFGKIYNEDSEAEANALLIANAPAMYRALKELSNFIDINCDWTKFNRQEIETIEATKELLYSINK